MADITPKATASTPSPFLISTKMLAKLLDRSVESIARDDKEGRLPTPCKLGASVKWDYREILAWTQAKCPSREVWQARETKGETSKPKGASRGKTNVQKGALLMNDNEVETFKSVDDYRVGPTPDHMGNMSILNGRPPTVNDIAAWLRLVVDPGDVIELRILNAVDNPRYSRFTVAGWFNDLDKLAQAALKWTRRAEGVYVTLNPTNPALIARACNRVIPRPQSTTTDHDVLRRTGLVFDADPVRPSGVSASVYEKTLAREVINRLVANLIARGWPEPILIDSGNGFHARYKIDLPTDDNGVVARVLKAADVLFSEQYARIDTSLGNASRIIRLPGRANRKGDCIPDRPHRWSQVIVAPDDFQVVPVELLEAFAAEVGTPAVPAGKPPEAVQPQGSGPRPGRAVSHDRRSPASRARAYVFAPGFPESVAGEYGHRQLYHAAAVLVDGFGLTFDQALPIFMDFNQERAHPPETDRHVRRTLNDAIGNNPVPSLKLLKADRHAHS